MYKKIILVILGLFLAWPVLAQTDTNQEFIRNFDSQITVNQDSSLTVTETIVVHSLGEAIQHGIYRDFPTRYKDRKGNNYNVGFELLSVKRDGEATTYDTEMQSNGIRIYIRDKNILLPPGDYIFQITYRTTRQLGFFTDHDELYWNVTGNGWNFPIDNASAEVTLPAGSDGKITTAGYTGTVGSREQNFQSSVTGNKVSFSAFNLDVYEGLTIVAGWPKGLVHEPTIAEKRADWLRDNFGLFAGLIGLIIVLLYYLWAWTKFGRDPQKGTIIPQYDSPRGLAPAAIGFIYKMGFSDRAFTGTIINLAVKGCLKIEKPGLHYHLKSLLAKEQVEGLKDEEKLIFEELFNSQDEIIIKQKNHEDIGGATDELKSWLNNNYKKTNFVLNINYFVIGVVLSLITIITTIGLLAGGNIALAPVAIFAIVWLSFWSIGVVALLFGVVKLWKTFLTSRSAQSFIAALFLTLFSLPFLGGEVAGIFMLSTASSFWIAPILIILLAVNFLFLFLLKAPTSEGRRLMDEIEGFKWFLSVTEKDRMNFHNPPQATPELFEKFLPYALVLGVENKWAEQFASVFAALKQSGNEYTPGWYSGVAFSSLAMGSFASSLGSSFSGAISSASVAPGSSSGFGGGGGSGGGGGGGGGGGC
ncbi:MAG: DUF2207 domain-containing protein [Patescibacteria group bacterium]